MTTTSSPVPSVTPPPDEPGRPWVILLWLALPLVSVILWELLRAK